MANYTPTSHQIYNEFDRFGLLLGLPRLENETNASYKQRLLDVFVHRSNSSYLGLIYGITRELGFSISDAFTLVPLVGGEPVIKFENTKCYVYSDYSNDIYTSIDRWDFDAGAYTIGELIDSINATGKFNAVLSSGANVDDRAMTVYNQSTVTTVPSENLTSGRQAKLKYQNIISSSIMITSSNILERVLVQGDLTKTYQYYVDTYNGIVYFGSVPTSGSTIRYKYFSNNYTVQASPIIISNLQSDDFKTKLFEQVATDDGDANGLPTALGADIINELLSVFATQWGI